MLKIPKLILGSVVVGFLWSCASPEGKKSSPPPTPPASQTQKSQQSTPSKYLSVYTLERENQKLVEKLAELDKQLEDARQLLKENPSLLLLSEKDIRALETKRDELQKKINARQDKIAKLRQLNLY